MYWDVAANEWKQSGQEVELPVSPTPTKQLQPGVGMGSPIEVTTKHDDPPASRKTSHIIGLVAAAAALIVFLVFAIFDQTCDGTPFLCPTIYQVSTHLSNNLCDCTGTVNSQGTCSSGWTMTHDYKDVCKSIDDIMEGSWGMLVGFALAVPLEVLMFGSIIDNVRRWPPLVLIVD